jgi:hypothetical protein
LLGTFRVSSFSVAADASSSNFEIHSSLSSSYSVLYVGSP